MTRFSWLSVRAASSLLAVTMLSAPMRSPYSDSDFENEGLAWMQERYEETRLRDYTLNGLSPRQFWMAQKLGDCRKCEYYIRVEVTRDL